MAAEESSFSKAMNNQEVFPWYGGVLDDKLMYVAF